MREEQQEKITNEVVDVQEPDALDELLEKVSLDDPLEIPMKDGRILSIDKERFIKYYLPRDATNEEAFHCFNQTRAAGLSPLIQGECHYFRTGGNPLRLFTGYPVYLRKAYAEDLMHIEKPDIEFGETMGQDPISCTITLTMKSERPDFIWTTWFDEVKGVTKGNQLNSRWQKAPNQMFIKCAVVNTLRMSGLVDFTLPYIIEEMGDPIMEGYRTLTEAQAEGHELPEASLGEVKADYHIDTTPMRKRYRGKIAKLELFPNDIQRKIWQEEVIGKKSTSDWDAMDYLEAIDQISSGKAAAWIQEHLIKPDPDPDPPATEKAAESVTDDPDAPHYHSGTDTSEMIGAETTEEQEEKDTPDEDFLIKPETLEAIKHELSIFPDKQYQTMRSNAFKAFAAEVVGVELETFNIKVILESDGQDIVTVLQEQRAELELAAKATQGVPKPEPEDDPENVIDMGGPRDDSGTQTEEITEDFVDIDEDDVDFIEPYIHKAGARFPTKLQRKQWESKNELPDLTIGDWPVTELKRGIALLEGVPEIVPMTDEQFGEMQELIIGMPERYHQNLGSQDFRTFRFKIVERKINTMRELTELEASDIIHEMTDAVAQENERIERMAEANKPTVI